MASKKTIHTQATIQRAAAVIADTLEAIDNRCMATDGSIPPTLRVATDAELRTLYRSALAIRQTARKAIPIPAPAKYEWHVLQGRVTVCTGMTRRQAFNKVSNELRMGIRMKPKRVKVLT